VSTEEDKFAHSKRLLKDDNAIKKQKKIADHYGNETPEHAYAKRHAMTCGNSNCVMCGNPRKFLGQVTQQEKRMMQDIEHVRNTRSNGASNDEDF
jgi:hypothetical protein